LCLCGDSILMTRTPDFCDQFTSRLDALSDQWKGVLFRFTAESGESLAEASPVAVYLFVIQNTPNDIACEMLVDTSYVVTVISRLYGTDHCLRCNDSGWIGATKDVEFLKTYKPKPFGINHFARAQEGTPSFVECPDCQNFFRKLEPPYARLR
jgi:hypothetical protein